MNLCIWEKTENRLFRCDAIVSQEALKPFEKMQLIKVGMVQNNQKCVKGSLI